PFRGPPMRVTAGDGVIESWNTVSLEGLKLGSVAVGFSTARLDALQTWDHRIAFAVLALWIGALVYSSRFARAFVTPIRAMMEFSRKVAGGELSERLSGNATGELAELRAYLNEMTADLERREAERKIVAAKAEAMQRELLTVSRTAGMAEVATGVLHNVGNVLNSLNVSVSVIGDQVRNSRVAALSKSIELFDAFPGGLPAFLSTPKGQVLPGYLSTVSKRLAEDNVKLLGELASVSRNVDHIKSIVAMQQAHARASDIREPVVLGELIDDALRMGESSFAKHGIEVDKHYGPLVPIQTDRHKLLQIVINLISNARHALKDSGAATQRLTVRIDQTPTKATIAIEDTGVGIPPENLGRIFEHGFTTKKAGHGFGLHSCANAARELGGELRAASAGSGCGATFTLELPLDTGPSDDAN
ncbi:MAG: ATP-binding protein, partial [Kofleriaceae bacterium]